MNDAAPMVAAGEWWVALCPQPQWCSWRDAGVAPECPDHPDAFVLHIRNGVATVESGGAPGAAYGAALVRQLEALRPAGVADCTVVDWPDLDRRGITLDCSRNQVPTVETLEALFATLAALRINHVELYLETTLAHPGHDDVWGPRDAYSFADVARLRAAAGAHHIELSGQQNALGHMEGWLACERFAHLAALPGGYTSPSGGHEPAATVEPTNEQAWALVSELVTNMATAFDAPRVHVGLDEPIDLNPAVWDAIFDVPGAPVPWAQVDNGSFCVPLPPERLAQYAQWANRLRALPVLAGREMLMWADVVAPHPELLDLLADGITLVEWGYEADHAFAARCGRIAGAGRPFWVAPGTSGWSAIGGRTRVMCANVDAAVRAAADHGGQGLLMTSWGANPAVIDLPGFVWAAGAAWNRRARCDLAAALDLVVVGRPGTGLGVVWTALGTISDPVVPAIAETTTASEMFRSGGMAGIGLALGGMTPDQLDGLDAGLAAVQAVLDGVAADLGPGGADGVGGSVAVGLRDELAWVHDALRWGARAARHRLDWPGAAGADELGAAHERLCEEHRRLWHRRNHHGGYDAVAAELAATRGGI